MNIKRWYTIHSIGVDGRMSIEKRKKLAHAQSLANKQSNDSVICHWEQAGNHISCLEIFKVAHESKDKETIS